MKKIELVDVSFLYGKGTPFEMVALDNVNVAFEKGKITGLIGHTGSGKSTLVNLLNGLNRPHSGEVLLDGQSIWAKPSEIAKIRYRVGLVMQYPEYQLFDETVRADIGFAPRNQGLAPEEINERVLEAARFTGVTEDMLDKSPFELSGGQKRRVAIAGIIAMEPKCIVLDEPTAMLDPRGRREVMQTITQLNRDKGITVILITHHMDEAAQAQRVIVLHNGKVADDGAPAEVFAKVENMHAIGLASPQTVELCYELNKNGFDLPLSSLDPDECAQILYDRLKV